MEVGKLRNQFFSSTRVQQGFKGALAGALFGLVVAGLDRSIKFLPSSVTPLRLTALSTTLFTLGFALRVPKMEKRVDLALVRSSLIQKLEIGEDSEPEGRALLLARLALHSNQAYLLILPHLLAMGQECDFEPEESSEDVANLASQQGELEEGSALIPRERICALMADYGFSIRKGWTNEVRDELRSLKIVAALLNLVSPAGVGAPTVGRWCQLSDNQERHSFIIGAVNQTAVNRLPHQFSLNYEEQQKVARLLDHFVFTEPGKWEAIKAEAQRQIDALGPKAKAVAEARFAYAFSHDASISHDSSIHIERLAIEGVSDAEEQALLLARVALEPNQAYLLALPRLLAISQESALPPEQLWSRVAPPSSQKVAIEATQVSGEKICSLMARFGFSIRDGWTDQVDERLSSLRVVATLLNLVSLGGVGAPVVGQWCQMADYHDRVPLITTALGRSASGPSRADSEEARVAQLLSQFVFTEPAKWEAIKAEAHRQIDAVGPQAEAIAAQHFVLALSQK